MLPLHQVAVELKNGWRIAIEWSDGIGRPEPAPLNKPRVVECEVETALDAVSAAGTPPIVFDSDRDGFSSIRLREQTDYLVDISTDVARPDAISAWKARPNWPLHDRMRRFYRSDPPRRWHSVDGILVISGRLNFKSHVGVADLSPDASGEFLVDVVPSKLGFLEDYPALLDSIAAHLTELLFRVEGPTFAPATHVSKDRATLISVLMQIRRAMSPTGIVAAIEELLHRPQTAVFDQRAVVPITLAADVDVVEIGCSDSDVLGLSPGGPLSEMFKGNTPAILPIRTRWESTDTPENRYVKHFLDELSSWLYTLRNALQEVRAPAALADVERWTNQVAEWQSHPMWTAVREMTHFPSNSQLLQRTATYRPILDADLALQLAVGLNWNAGFSEADDLLGELKPVDKLYEYWCFFELWAALEYICGAPIGTTNIMSHVSSGISVTLKRGVESAIRFAHGHDRIPVSLYYNRTFNRSISNEWRDSYSGKLAPDFSITVETRSGATRKIHWVHFDAKYRLDFAQWQRELESIADDANAAESLIETYKQEDLFKMHTYRDALLGSRGSYVLFPGQTATQEIFVRYPATEYPTAAYAIPSVGALQLRPNNAEQRATLLTFLSRLLNEVGESHDYGEETGLFGS